MSAPLRLPAAPVQARLWRARATPATPLALEARLSGPLRADVLQAAFAAVRARQEILRTTFAEHRDAVVQVVHPTRGARWLAPGEAGAAAHTLLGDLSRGPLVLAGLDAAHTLRLIAHPAVADYRSLELLAEEILAAYAAQLGVAEEPALEPVEFADVCIWIEQQLGELLTEPAGPDAPTAGLTSAPGDDPETREADARALGCQLVDVALAARLAHLSAEADRHGSGEREVVVEIGVTGRRPETRRVIGPFADIAAVPVTIPAGASTEDLITIAYAARHRAETRSPGCGIRLVGETAMDQRPILAPSHRPNPPTQWRRAGITVHTRDATPLPDTPQPDRSLTGTPLADAPRTHAPLTDNPHHPQVSRRDLALPPGPEEVLALIRERAGQGRHAGVLAEAARLGGALRRRGVAVEDALAICLTRGPDLVPALLATWWAGASYVPLDAAYPPDRLAAMLEDSHAPVVLVDSATRALIAGLDVPGHPELIDLDELRADSAQADAPVPVPASAAAYTIFTSGSTGRPKGVTIPRSAVSALLRAFAEVLDLGASDRFVAVTTLSFDISVLELLLPLVTGSELIVADEESAADALALRDVLHAERATAMQATPATWRALAGIGGIPDGLRLRLCGGEALPRDLATILATGPDGTTAWNVYGPTETTVWSAAGRVEVGADGQAAPVLVGPPLPGTRWYVLDDHLAPVRDGVVGDVWIAGAGVARGYLARPAQTADAFRPDREHAGERMYRTGDVGVLLPDGRIALHGRADHQVKIRGYRIELEEIEVALRRVPGIADAVVSAVVGPTGDPADRHLVAFIAPDLPPEGTEHVRESIGRSLPAYMVPSVILPLSELPRTPNGKLDRRALPEVSWGMSAAIPPPAEPPPAEPPPAEPPPAEPPLGDPPQVGRAPGLESRHTGPEAAARLAALWSELLGVPDPAPDDNFFALGGHSLTATFLVARIQTEFDVQIRLRQLLRHPTITAQLELIAAAPPRVATSTPVAEHDAVLAALTGTP